MELGPSRDVRCGFVTQLPSWLPDGYSQIFRSFVFGSLDFWTMAPLHYGAKFDPFLSLDCARVQGVGVQCVWTFRILDYGSAALSCKI